MLDAVLVESRDELQTVIETFCNADVRKVAIHNTDLAMMLLLVIPIHVHQSIYETEIMPYENL